MPSHPPTKRQPITPKKKKAKVPNVNNPNRSPEENYNRLSDIDKCICYFYKINLDSGDGNIVGWNYKAAGSTAHFRHYDKIYSAFTSPSAFRSRAIVSVMMPFAIVAARYNRTLCLLRSCTFYDCCLNV